MNNYNQENNSGRRMTGARFRGKRTGGRRFDRRNQGRSNMFPVTCDKCGKNCEVPFRPTVGKPVFCSDCFENKGKGKNHFGKSSSGENYEKLKEQFGILNAKLDKILSFLASDVISKSAPKENVSQQIQEIKEMKPKKAAKKLKLKRRNLV